MGLLILRLVLAGHLITEGSARVVADAESGGSNSVAVVVGAALILGGALVVAGLLTPVVHTALAIALVGVAGVRIWSLVPAMTMSEVWTSGVLDAAIAVSIALLGPGAYSMDARLFGRREVVIRPRIHPPIH